MPGAVLAVVLALGLGLLARSERARAAGGIEVFRSPEGVLLLQGGDCDGVRRQVSALRSWTRSLDETISGYPAHVPVREGGCIVGIAKSVPRFVRENHGFAPAQNGPNCWDTALVLAGLVPGSRYASPREMSFWMNSSMCRQVGPRESLRPGDVGAIRSRAALKERGFSEYHGFIYLTPELSFSKNGFSREAPFALQPLSRVLASYDVTHPEKCDHVSGRPEGCQSWVEYYRCEPPTDTIRSKPSIYSASYAYWDDEISEMEHQLARVASGKGRPQLYYSREAFVAALDQMAAGARKGRAKRHRANGLGAGGPGNSDEEQALWDSLLHRISSLRDQVRLIQWR